MASITPKSGKCSNFGNCSIADARVSVEVPSGLDFVCNECGKPLLLTDGGQKSGSPKALIVGAALLAIVLVGGGAAWFSLTRNKAPAVAPPTPVQAPAAPAAVTAPPAPAPAAPVNGHCSAADERAGLCTAAR